MKRTAVICLLGSLSYGIGAMAQASLPAGGSRLQTELQNSNTIGNYIGADWARMRMAEGKGWYAIGAPNPYVWIDLPDLSSIALETQKPYMEALSRFMGQRQTDEHVLLQFLEIYAHSIDHQRARLLLSLAYLQKGDRDRGLYHLRQIEHEGLNAEESSQAYTLQAAALVQSKGESLTADDRLEVRTLLELGSRYNTLWGDRALLYLAWDRWYEGKVSLAEEILSREEWRPELKEEVVYLQTLIRLSSLSPSEAMRVAQQALREYPSLRTRPRMIGSMAQIYYSLGDYQGAIKTLGGLTPEELTSAEAYALGASHYELRHYEEAQLPLQRASSDEGLLGLQAQFALANIYKAGGDVAKAQLAFSSIADHPKANATLREESLYQLLELGFESKTDIFGRNLRLMERFLSEYPRSKYTKRLTDLVQSYLADSKDFAQSLTLLERLSERGLPLQPTKQELLVRWAESLGAGAEGYAERLNQAISLGALSPSWAYALLRRGETSLKAGAPAQAESDFIKAIDYQRSSGRGDQTAELLYLLGYSRYNQGRYAEAYEAFDRFRTRSTDKALTADALGRMGDYHQTQKGQTARAINLYEEAYRLDPEGNDEALYQIAYMQWKGGRYADQLRSIARLKAQHPSSRFLPNALYYEGRALLIGQKDREAARQTFKALEERFPTSEFAPMAALEQALLYSNEGKDAEAIEQYKRLIAQYPDSPQALSAMSDLRSLYAENNRLDEYLAYSRTLGEHLRLQGDDEARLEYQALLSRLTSSSDDEAEALLKGYIASHPNSSSRPLAEERLARLYQKRGQSAEAITLVTRMLSSEQDLKRKQALSDLLGDLYMTTGDWKRASGQYQQSFELSNGNRPLYLHTGLKLSEAALQHSDPSLAQATLSKLEALSGLSTDEMARVTLLKGRSQEVQKGFRSAIDTYTKISDQTDSPYGAEAVVRRADVLLRLGQTDESIATLEDFTSKGSNQSYWLARGFILLSDAYAKKGESYLAEQYLQSLRDNYTGTEPDIFEMIDQRLNTLKKN